jgi:excisionase family DNA binding protein
MTISLNIDYVALARELARELVPFLSPLAAPVPLYLTVKDAADRLSLSVQTIYVAAQRGELPSVRPGRSRAVRIEAAALYEWAERAAGAR